MGNCEPISQLDLGDLFVASNGNLTIRMMSAAEFFHAQNAKIQYIGTVSGPYSTPYNLYYTCMHLKMK
jgi:hypothetical protein